MEKYYVLANKRKEHLDNENLYCNNCKIHSICGYGCIGLANMKDSKFDGECEYRVMMCTMYSFGIIERPNKLNNKEEFI